jgi:protein-tyrosine phosphatase
VTVRVLYVCTANQCRSPIAAALTTRLAHRGGVVAASAGLLEGGHPAPERARRAALHLGVDLEDHRSRTLGPDDLDRADLILPMTREHAREIVAAWPEAWPRVFPLKQFVRWVAAQPPARDGDFREWLTRTASARSLTDIVGNDPVDDIADPLARPPRVWRRSMHEIHAAVGSVVELLDQ